MALTKITDADIGNLKIASLPSRPTAPKSFGGAGYTAKQMKEAFDRLPMYIISRFNELIDALSLGGKGGVCSLIPTDITEDHTLLDMFEDVVSGAFADYLTVLGAPLTATVSELKESIRTLKAGATLSAEELEASIDRIEGLEKLIEDVGVSLENLSSRIDTNSDGIKSLTLTHEADVKEIGARCDAADSTLKQLSERVSSAESSIGSIGKEHAADVALLKAELLCPESITIDCGGPEGLA